MEITREGFITKARIHIQGFTGQPAEMKTTPSGKKCLEFAIGTGSKDHGNSEWWNMKIWQKAGENAEKFFKEKGVAVVCVARLKLNAGKQENGNTRIFRNCDVDSMWVCPPGEQTFTELDMRQTDDSGDGKAAEESGKPAAK